MKEEMLTLPKPALYKLSGCPLPLYNNMVMLGCSTIKSGMGIRLEYPERTPSASASGKRMAKKIQKSLYSADLGNLDDEMRSLRGRSWSL